MLNSPAAAVYVTTPDLTLNWSDYLSTKTESPTGSGSGTQLSDEAASYDLQVATDCAFNNAVTLPVSNTEFVQATIPTPADGTYYWRVQSVDATDNPLTWGDAPNRASGCAGVRSFTVDRTPPVATTTAAANNRLSVSWSEHVNGFASSQLQLIDETTQQAVTGAMATLAADGQSATVTPGPFLVPGHSYGIQLTSAAVTDDAGNAVVLAPGALPVSSLVADRSGGSRASRHHGSRLHHDRHLRPADRRSGRRSALRTRCLCR